MLHDKRERYKQWNDEEPNIITHTYLLISQFTA